MDLRSWVLADHATALQRLERQVLDLVTPDRWAERADGGGNSIGWGVLHAWYHQDVALSVARGVDPLMSERRDALGLTGLAPFVGMGEAEIDGTVAAVDPAALVPYVRDVHTRTAEWLAGVDLAVLDTVPAASSGLSELAGIGRDDADWLHDMWTDKPVGWFVQWECIGHGHTHMGEMVSVRNRMGLSPF
ncbi:MAG TPA: DinB family protein [Ilumatobacteraceae bacterium]|nr:DinB family protein [Ilumatobacteraceae bacterium]